MKKNYFFLLFRRLKSIILIAVLFLVTGCAVLAPGPRLQYQTMNDWCSGSTNWVETNCENVCANQSSNCMGDCSEATYYTERLEKDTNYLVNGDVWVTNGIN